MDLLLHYLYPILRILVALAACIFGAYLAFRYLA